MDFEIGNMVHYMNEGEEGFGVIESMNDEGYSVRVYAMAGDDFIPSDQIVNVDEVHSVEDYIEKTVKQLDQEDDEINEEDEEKAEVPNVEIGDFVEWDAETGLYKGIVSKVDDELTVHVIEDSQKTGISVDLPLEAARKIEAFEVEDEEGEKTKFVGKIKSVKVEEDEDNNLGIIEGYLSVYDNTDLGGDVVKRGAFTQTLSHKSGKLPLLMDHGYFTRDVAGVIYATDDEKGLRIRGEMNLKVQHVKEAYETIKFNTERGVPLGLSIGYNIINSVPNDKGGYNLTEVALEEGSITPFPMNTQALIDTVKRKKTQERIKKYTTLKAAESTSKQQDEQSLVEQIKQLTMEINNV